MAKSEAITPEALLDEMNAKNNPTIAMRDFFSLPAVIAAQDIQKANPHGSPAHRAAWDSILELATTHGAESFFEDGY